MAPLKNRSDSRLISKFPISLFEEIFRGFLKPPQINLRPDGFYDKDRAARKEAAE